jgi:hypothetical protein
MSVQAQTRAQPKACIMLPLNFLGDVKPNCAIFPSNNVSEGNTMIANSSGFFQVKERKTLNFQQFTLQPKGSKNINHRDENGVENLKHRDQL